MNKIFLLGRLVRDPELKTTTSQISVASFTIAVDRKFKNANGEKQADFIGCVAWRQQADFVTKYFRKGSKIIVIGSLQIRSWDDQEGKKHTIAEVVVDEIHFAGDKSSQTAATSGAIVPPVEDPTHGGFFPGADDDTALPFDI